MLLAVGSRANLYLQGRISFWTIYRSILLLSKAIMEMCRGQNRHLPRALLERSPKKRETISWLKVFISRYVLIIGEDIGHFAEPPKPPLPVNKGTFGEFEEQIRVLDGSQTIGMRRSVRFVDEHFPAHSVFDETAFLCSDSIVRLRLRNGRVVWNLHDGYDWPRTRDAIAIAVEKLEHKAAEALAAKARRRTPQPTRTVTLPEVLYGEDPWTFDEEEEDGADDDSEIGDILFQSIYVGVRRGQDPRALARNINRELDAQSETMSQASSTPSTPLRSSRGGSPGYTGSNPLDRVRQTKKSLRLKRSKSQKVQINLRSLGVGFDLFPEPLGPGETALANLRLKVGDLEILDNVPTSSWNKFVTYWRRGEGHKRETSSPMVDLEVVNVKPVQHLSATELVVKLSFF
jgi:Autophagy-related protein 2, middle RBG modules